MHLKIYSSEDEQSYRRFLAVSPQASIYHTLEWKDVIETIYGYSPCYIIAQEDGDIKGFLPLFSVNHWWTRNKLVCLPYSHMVQPLYDSDNVLEALLDFAEAYVQQLGAQSLQIRWDLSAKRDGWSYSEQFIESKLSLTGEIDDIWDGMKSSIRRNVRKARKKNVVIELGKSLDDYEKFYELMVETRKRQGSPAYSRFFFERLYNNFRPSELQLYLAYVNNTPIAGLIMLSHNKDAIYAYGASTSESSLLQYRPNDLLFWTAIKDAHGKGYTSFDFGISPLSNPGLIRFKSQWGTVNSKAIYSHYLNKTNKTPGIDREGTLVRLSSLILKRLPICLLKRIGPIMLRYLG